MNQLATIPFVTWFFWAWALILVVLMILAMRKLGRFRPEFRKSTATSIAWVGGMVTGIFIVLGVVSWRIDVMTQQKESATINQAIEADPNLSRMANVAEALGWMDEEVGPLVLKLNRATERLERLERDREAAIAEIKVINAQLGEKEQEFEERFGHLIER